MVVFGSVVVSSDELFEMLVLLELRRGVRVTFVSVTWVRLYDSDSDVVSDAVGLLLVDCQIVVLSPPEVTTPEVLVNDPTVGSSDSLLDLVVWVV